MTIVCEFLQLHFRLLFKLSLEIVVKLSTAKCQVDQQVHLDSSAKRYLQFSHSAGVKMKKKLCLKSHGSTLAAGRFCSGFATFKSKQNANLRHQNWSASSAKLINPQVTSRDWFNISFFVCLHKNFAFLFNHSTLFFFFFIVSDLFFPFSSRAIMSMTSSLTIYNGNRSVLSVWHR